jgi:ribosomal protein S27AE
MSILILCQWLGLHSWTRWTIEKACVVYGDGSIAQVNIQRRNCMRCGYTVTEQLPG